MMSRACGFTTTVTAIAFTLLTAPLALAQPAPGRGMGMMPGYHKSTEVTLKGTVEAVVAQPERTGGMPADMPRGMMAGMGGTHLTFRSGADVYDVHLGPANWLAEKTYAFAKGDALEIVGSSVTMHGQKALIAREITRGDQKITLRDADGIPAWSGRGRHGSH